MELAADVLEIAGAIRKDPIQYEGLRETYLPECKFRGKNNRKIQYAILHKCIGAPGGAKSNERNNADQRPAGGEQLEGAPGIHLLHRFGDADATNPVQIDDLVVVPGLPCNVGQHLAGGGSVTSVGEAR